jgi:hypothetical protein
VNEYIYLLSFCALNRIGTAILLIGAWHCPSAFQTPCISCLVHLLSVMPSRLNRIDRQIHGLFTWKHTRGAKEEPFLASILVCHGP